MAIGLLVEFSIHHSRLVLLIESWGKRNWQNLSFLLWFLVRKSSSKMFCDVQRILQRNHHFSIIHNWSWQSKWCFLYVLLEFGRFICFFYLIFCSEKKKSLVLFITWPPGDPLHPKRSHEYFLDPANKPKRGYQCKWKYTRGADFWVIAT